MAGVTFERVSKAYGDNVVVRDLDLVIDEGEFLVLVGPSGCGKSTCLRMIAGLEEITAGTIRIGQQVVNDLPPQHRDIAMVFQNYALYPHMSVYDNLAFGLRLRRESTGRGFPRHRRKYDEAEIRRRVAEAARLLGLSDLLQRKPKQLSGGQRQRVALGRAIVREPQVFLMDEPLSNLDAKLRVQTRAELILLHQRLQQEGRRHSTVYVTHDQTEAMTMGDRIAVLRDGVLQQVAPPLELYRRPANRFVAEFIGTPQMNVLGPFAAARRGDAVMLHRDGVALEVPAAGRSLAKLGDQVLLGLRPEDIFDAAGAPVPATLGNTLPVTVTVREPLGPTVELTLAGPAGIALTAVLDADSPRWREDRWDAVLQLDKAHLFDPVSELAVG